MTRIISYPKSGRTWVRAMLGAYSCYLLEKELRWALSEPVIATALSCKKIKFTHEPLAEKADRPIVWLHRGPEDTLVSYYYHMKYRDKTFNGSMSDFIRSEEHGAPALARFENMMADHINESDKALVLSYENIHSDPLAALYILIGFISSKGVNPRCAALSVKFCDIGNLRRLERSDFFNNAAGKPKSENPKGAKFRKGIVGAYKSELKKADVKFIRNTLAGNELQKP